MDLFKKIYKWLSPGMKIKRWIFLSWIGLVLLTIGLILYIQIRPFISVEMAIVNFFSKVTGYSIKSQWVDLAFIFAGMVLLLLGIRQWFLSIYEAVVPDKNKNIVDVVYEERHLGQGIRVVTVGGGTGLSSLLRGLKKYTSNITAVVTVSDDGGSSGRLREEMGVLPPGDIRNCLVALADQENLLGSLFQYRFTDGEALEGHSFGNLFLVAMTSITGDFDTAIKESSKILAIKGRVLPATLSPVTLGAVMEDGNKVVGESSITSDSRRIDHVFLKPTECSPPDEVISAISEADLIVLGPGSLYTSIIPNLLIGGIVEAINASRAVTVYVCNVMTQPGETDGYKASDHLNALLKQAAGLKVDYCLVNDEVPPSNLLKKYEKENQYPVEADLEAIRQAGVLPISASLISAVDLVRHDPEKLAFQVVSLVERKETNPVFNKAGKGGFL